MMAKILVVDDEDGIRENLVEQFALEGDLKVAQASDARQALAIVATECIDLVVMDVGLPDMDGREAVRTMRAAGFRAPVVMLSGFASDEDAIKGLEAGAYDYVTKPFRFAVLMARVRTHLRIWERSGESTWGIGDSTFRYSAREIVDQSGVQTRLTEKEAGILRLLLQAQGEPVPRESLLRDVWGYARELDTHTLETHVYRLRRKLGAASPRLLTTAGGYRFEGTGEAKAPEDVAREMAAA